MRSNAWTTLEEFTFLDGLIPQFLTQQGIRVVGPWLAETAAAFADKFPLRSAKFDRDRLTNKLRTWFGNHTRDLVKGTDSRHVLDLSGKANRRPLPLQQSQAYSALYYREGSAIYKEIKKLYALYKSGDPATLSSLRRLFEESLDDDLDAATLPSASNLESHPDGTPPPPKATRRSKRKTNPAATSQPDTTTPHPDTTTPQPDDPPTVPTKPTKKKGKSKKKATADAGHSHYVPPFVHFQQTIIREKLKAMSNEEAAAVERHVEDAYAHAMKVWEQPWLGVGKSSKPGDSQADEFYMKNANRIDHSLQIVGEEINRQTLFRTFFIWGGPGVVPGTVDILSADTGLTIEGKQPFTAFLGPMYRELQQKFRQWIQLTYTYEQLHRQSAPKVSPQPHGDPKLPSVPSTPTLDQSISVNLALDTDAPDADSDTVGPTTTNSSVVTSTATDPGIVIPATTNPGVIIPTATDPSVVIPTATNPGVAVPATTDPGSDNPTTANPRIINPTTTDPGVVAPTSTDPDAATSTDVVGLTTNTPSADGAATTGPHVDGSTIAGPATTNPNADPTSVMHSTLGPTLIDPGVIIPTTMVPGPGPPSLTINATGYPKFVTPEVILHLSSITNVDGWSDLVSIYLEFESTSQSKSTTRLPAKGRPPEVDAWLKDPANVSMPITDVTAYVKAWTDWWVSCQPPGRAAASWPFASEPFSRDQCTRLLNGGRNGIFLFVMALSWWAKSLDPTTSSPDLTGAVADVKWVLHHLTGILTTPLAPEPTPEVAPDTPDVGRGKRKVTLTEKALDLGENVQKRYRRN